jgi:hypothetical protein
VTDVARITRHPTDRDVVLLHTPPDARDRLGKFGPARYSPEHHAYVLHHTHIDALYRFAKATDMHVVDERNSSKRGPGVPPTECRVCGQAGSKPNPPRMCPACGNPWRPIGPPVREDPINRTPCPSCGHKQPGRFAFCSRCGTPMDYPQRTVRPALPRPEKRVHLDDPLPLGDVARDLAASTPELANVTWGRRIEDTPLPGDTVDQQPEPDEYDPTTEPDWPAADVAVDVDAVEAEILCACPYRGLPGEHTWDATQGCPTLDEPDEPDEPVVEDPPTPSGWGA